jgi:hypothetical protein
MSKKITVGQKVRHADFKGVGRVAQILANGTRVHADFLGTRGVIDDVRNFQVVKPRELTTAEEKMIDHLLANGWGRGWISQQVLDTVIEHEKKVRSRKPR